MGKPSVDERPSLESDDAAEGERKTITALFADIKGSTELIERLDPEEARAIVDPALKLMVDAVRGYDGYVVQSTGDGIFALFGAPLAHEDHPQRALYAAVRMQEALREHARRLAGQGKSALEARIGINTGEVVMRIVETGGRREYTPIGIASNLAARLQTAAPAGGIAISDDTRRLVEGYFEVRGLGPTEVKGIGRPINVYQVVGLGALRGHFELAARRGLTRFVGRQDEIAQIKRSFERARGGHGQIVVVVAEAGTGKSRLFYELKAMIPAEWKVLEAYSVSHGKGSAWLPVLELLRNYFGLADTDDPTVRREKVRATLAALDPALIEVLPYLFALLGVVESPDPLAQMDPQIKRRRTLDAVKRIVLRESLNQPLVVIVEDLHWIDEQTQTMLDLLADGIGNARVVLLVNYRPEYRHEWGNKSYYVQLALNPLGRESAEELLTALLEEAAELRPLKHLIIERTGGNPFFIEEMVQALFDEGALVRNGAVKVTRSVSQLRLPPTVQGILAARIDRLSRDQKELLQTLAVIGRQSPLGLIRKVASNAETRLEQMLADLGAGEFIHEQPALPDVEYVFKHALTQEVAYNSLLIERRRQLHERAGQALEAMFGEQLDDHLDELAHHYSRTENIAKAVEYLGRAGHQALHRSAHAEAVSSLSKAIDLLERRPNGLERVRQELLLQLALGAALSAVKGRGAPEVEQVFLRARRLCGQVQDPAQSSPALYVLGLVELARGELRKTYELAQELLERSQNPYHPTLSMYAHGALGNPLFWMGEFLTSKENHEIALSLYDSQQHREISLRYGGIDAKVACLSYMALNLWAIGYPEQALKAGNQSLASAKELSRPFSLAFSEIMLCALHQLRGDIAATNDVARHLTAVSAEHGFTEWLALSSVLLGWATVKQRFDGGAIEQMHEGVAGYRATGATVALPYFLTMVADACREMGRLDEGIQALTEAQALADEHEIRHCETEIHRLKGELLLMLDHSHSAEAHTCFRHAIATAQKQSAKSLELRASSRISQLLATQGRHDEARMMLAEIYGWFTEGFDTADLKDAKALLDELSG